MLPQILMWAALELLTKPQGGEVHPLLGQTSRLAVPTPLGRGTGQGRTGSVPQCQHSKHIWAVIQRQEAGLGCSTGSLHPSAAHDSLVPASGGFSRQHKPLWPVLRVVCVVPGHGWAAVRSVLRLGAGFWLPCSELAQHGDGAGHCLHLPVAQTHSQPCALPLSIPACSDGEGSLPHICAGIVVWGS